MRFYQQLKSGELKILRTAQSPAQARELVASGKVVYPSITTVLSIAPKDEGFERWCNSALVELARACPEKTVEELIDDRWGFAPHPDGYTVRSRDFGTMAHAQMEEANRLLMEGADYRNDTWDRWVKPWLAYCWCENIKPTFVEHKVRSPKYHVAGTLDLVSSTPKGCVLFDYKFRSNGTARDKDGMQLALSADIIREDLGLDEMPAIRSVIINPDTADMKIHAWTPKKQAKMLRKAAAICEFFRIWYDL